MEKRVVPRYSVAVQCRFFHSDRVVDGKAKDVSTRGLRLVLQTTDELEPIGIVSIFLIGGESISQEIAPLNVGFTLVWKKPDGEERTEVGLEFDSLTEEQETLVGSIVSKFNGVDEDAGKDDSAG